MKKYAVILALLAMGRVSGQTVVALAEYESNSNPSGNSLYALAAHVTGTGMQRVGINWASGSNFSATNFTTSLSPNTGSYFQISVTPAAGHSISVTHILLNFSRDNNGPTSIQLRTSADNFASPILIDGAINSGPSGDGLDLSGIAALQNITTTATFRIYGYHAASSSGVLYTSAYPGYTTHLLPTGGQAGVVLQGHVF